MNIYFFPGLEVPKYFSENLINKYWQPGIARQLATVILILWNHYVSNYENIHSILFPEPGVVMRN